MSVEFEASFSDRLGDILTGRLNTGTPQWVLEKTQGMHFSDGQNVLFLTGLLPVSSKEEKKVNFINYYDTTSFQEGNNIFYNL